MKSTVVTSRGMLVVACAPVCSSSPLVPVEHHTRPLPSFTSLALPGVILKLTAAHLWLCCAFGVVSLRMLLDVARPSLGLLPCLFGQELPGEALVNSSGPGPFVVEVHG